jgi:CubicO group peptidase (beta-lactamase class C family)
VNKKSHALLVSCFLVICPGMLVAGELPTAKPEEIGLSSAGLEKASAAVRQLVKDGKVAGTVVLAVRHGKIAFFEAQGVRDVATGKPMEKDTIFRIYSMTKPITTVAAMILYDQGRFQLDDPVSKYLPEFKGVKVYAGGKGDMKLVAAKREMTIRDLMRHTSGLTLGFADTPVDELYRKNKILGPGDTLEKTVEKLGKLPLVNQPGTRFDYSVSTDVLGRLVEVLSKKSLDTVVRKQIFEPLDMKDTAYYVPEKKQNRFAAMHGRNPKGKLIVTDAPALPSNFGGHGLVSTARDYARFCQMLLGKGQLDGKRILQEKTVALMTKNHLPAEAMPISIGGFRFPEGVGFGLGFSVLAADNKEPGSRVGEYNWGGAAGTTFWTSPKDDLFVIVMQQSMPVDPLLVVTLKPLIYAAVQEPKE